MIRVFPDGSVVKNHLIVQEMWVRSLGQADPLQKEMATHSSILTWDIPWTEDRVGYSPRGCKELDMTERLHSPSQMGYVLTR